MKLKLIIILVLLSLLFGGIAGGYIAVSRNIPSIEELKRYDPSGGTRIYSDDDVLIEELKIEKGIFIPIDSIPKNMINALVAVEDATGLAPRQWQQRPDGASGNRVVSELGTSHSEDLAIDELMLGLADSLTGQILFFREVGDSSRRVHVCS